MIRCTTNSLPQDFDIWYGGLEGLDEQEYGEVKERYKKLDKEDEVKPNNAGAKEQQPAQKQPDVTSQPSKKRKEPSSSRSSSAVKRPKGLLGRTIEVRQFDINV